VALPTVRQPPGSPTATESRYFSIWDGDGHDTIDASGPAFAVPLVDQAYIDLRPGHFSSTGPSTGVDVVGGSVVDRGYANVSIAFGAVIEDAVGTDFNDAIIGNVYANKLSGGDGDDVIYGSGSAVAEVVPRYAELGIAPNAGAIDTDDGDYRKITQGGTVSGGQPDEASVTDEIHGGSGNDLLVSGIGPSTIYGDAGDDKLVGGGGTDSLYGGEGNGSLWGDVGNDELHGGAGNDLLDGGDDGNDWLEGGEGNDVLIFNANSYVVGGAGNDVFWLVKASAPTDYYWIGDSDLGDSLYWNGYQLNGGPKTIIDYENIDGGLTYTFAALDSHGIIYSFGPGADALQIELPDGTQIVVADFQDGDLGINVGGRWTYDDVDVTTGPDGVLTLQTLLPFSNIVHDGVFGDFENPYGASTAVSTLGPVSLPDLYLV